MVSCAGWPTVWTVELVYALVSSKPLREVVQDRANQLAREEVYGVAHTMGLEDQWPTDERTQK